MRAFVAVPVPDEVADALARVQQAFTMGRVVPPENLHVTLAFLEDQPLGVLEAVHDALSEIELPEFPIYFRGLEVLGGKVPKLACAIVDNTPPLARLRDRVRAAARAADIALPRERYRPHVTLARFRRGMAPDEVLKLRDVLERYGGAEFPGFQASSFALIQSRLLPEGAQYDTMADYPLKRATT